MTLEQIFLTVVFNILGFLMGSLGVASLIALILAPPAVETEWEWYQRRGLAILYTVGGGFMYFMTLFGQVPR